MASIFKLTLLLAGTAVLAGRNFMRETTETGDQQCGEYMCVKATVIGSSIQYELSSTGKSEPGWMAMGFGEGMVDSPMIIIWSNKEECSFTLSQREADGHSPPHVVCDPERFATLSEDLSVASGSDTKFTFTVDANGESGIQKIIYAFGDTNPGSSDAGADLAKHIEAGALELDLSGTTTSHCSR